MHMSIRRRSLLAGFRVGYLAMFALLIAPLIVIVGSSLAESSALRFPPEVLSLRWYAEFLSDSAWRRAVANSLIVSTGTTVVATPLGLSAA